MGSTTLDIRFLLCTIKLVCYGLNYGVKVSSRFHVDVCRRKAQSVSSGYRVSFSVGSYRSEKTSLSVAYVLALIYSGSIMVLVCNLGDTRFLVILLACVVGASNKENGLVRFFMNMHSRLAVKS
jgi:hypothetical protein